MVSRPPKSASVAEVILARLLVTAANGHLRSRVKRDLAPWFDHRLGAEAWGRAFDESLAELMRSGKIQRPATNRIALTEAGRRAAYDLLGTAAPPAKLNWQVLRDGYLMPRALGLSPPPTSEARKRLTTPNGLRAAILRQHFDLPIAEFPTLTQARDALVWKLLGRENAERVTVTNVLKYVLNQELDPARPAPAPEAPKRIAQKVVKARNADASQLRLAILRQWCEGASSPASAHMDLAAFAERVRAAARHCSSGRFGADKVFISHVWRQMRGDLDGMDLASFKRRLAEANHTHLLRLSRADLVEAMEPRDVEESQTEYLHAQFHFIRI
jgi:hypothetical protein